MNITFLEICLMIILILLSGLFSGLTLGLLSIDPLNLDIIIENVCLYTFWTCSDDVERQSWHAGNQSRYA